MKQQKTSYGSVTISTSINHNLWIKAKSKNISWAEAMRRGISAILADLGDEDFINPLQLQRKLAELSSKYEAVFQENLALQEAAAKARGFENGTNPKQ